MVRVVRVGWWRGGDTHLLDGVGDLRSELLKVTDELRARLGGRSGGGGRFGGGGRGGAGGEHGEVDLVDELLEHH